MSVHRAAESPCAIGRLAPGGPWVGFQADAGGYRFVVGIGVALRSSEADVDLLLALAIAYFTEALDGAPPDLEATQADMSALVADLTQRATDTRAGGLLREALDAIDDGLAGDAVAGRLAAARPVAEATDPIELLRARGMELAARS